MLDTMLLIAAIVMILCLPGCAGVPTIKYCDDITYTRAGNKIHIEADCKVPMNDGSSNDSLSSVMSAIMAAIMFL